MFTGIVQGMAQVASLVDQPGLRTITLQFPFGFCQGLEVGASVAVDGVCLTVTRVQPTDVAEFDVMQQSLGLTTLAQLHVGSQVNVERATREGAEIGGHPLSGHVDAVATVSASRRPQNNCVLTLEVPAPWMRYIFAKGYIAVQGASLTVAEVTRLPGGAGRFEVWLIPETLRVTTLGQVDVGARLNIEIDRSTQVMVDTVRDAIEERLGPLWPALQAFAQERGIELEDSSNLISQIAAQKP